MADDFFRGFKKDHDLSQTMQKLMKSPGATGNFLDRLDRHMGNRPVGVSPEDWKALRSKISDMSRSKDPRKFLKDFFG